MFTVHTAQSAPEGSREALAALERNIGFIPNLAATIAGSPAALQAFGAMQTALRGSTLSALEREVVGLAVSHENASRYSMAAATLSRKTSSKPHPMSCAIACWSVTKPKPTISMRML